MPLTYTPLALKGLDLQDPRQLQEFQKQLCDFLNAAFTAPGLSGILNGALLLAANSFSSKITDLGTITTNQTVQVAGAAFVYVRLTSAITQTLTLTLTNLPQGAVVSVIAKITANTLTLKMAATDTAGHAYTITAVNTVTGTPIDMVGTGQAIGVVSAQIYFGESGFISTSATPDLTMLAA